MPKNPLIDPEDTDWGRRVENRLEALETGMGSIVIGIDARHGENSGRFVTLEKEVRDSKAALAAIRKDLADNTVIAVRTEAKLDAMVLDIAPTVAVNHFFRVNFHRLGRVAELLDHVVEKVVRWGQAILWAVAGAIIAYLMLVKGEPVLLAWQHLMALARGQ